MAAVAGLGGTDVVTGVGIERVVFPWLSLFMEFDAGEFSMLGNVVAAAISSFPGG